MHASVGKRSHSKNDINKSNNLENYTSSTYKKRVKSIGGAGLYIEGFSKNNGNNICNATIVLVPPLAINKKISSIKNFNNPNKKNVSNDHMTISHEDGDDDLEYLDVEPQGERLHFVTLYEVYKEKIENAKSPKEKEKFFEELTLKIKELTLTPEDMRYEIKKYCKKMKIVEGDVIGKWNEYLFEDNSKNIENSSEDFFNFLANDSKYKSFNEFLYKVIKDVENEIIIIRDYNEYCKALDKAGGNDESNDEADKNYLDKMAAMVKNGYSFGLQYEIIEKNEEKKKKEKDIKNILEVWSKYIDNLEKSENKPELEEKAHKNYSDAISKIIKDGASPIWVDEVIYNSGIKNDFIEILR